MLFFTSFVAYRHLVDRFAVEDFQPMLKNSKSQINNDGPTDVHISRWIKKHQHTNAPVRIGLRWESVL